MTPERACAKCGKKGDFERLCPRCWQSEHTLLKEFKPVKAELCAKCGKVHLASKWIAVKDLDDAFSRVISRNAKPSPGVSVRAIEAGVELPEHRINEGISVNGEADLSVSADVQEVKAGLTEQYRIPVTLRYTLCPHCNKANTQYYEGVLQLRNAGEEVRDAVKSELAKCSLKGVHLTKEKEVKGGVDYYITSGTFLRSFATDLHNRYGGELKLTARLFSRDRLTSREVYRVMALIRLPDFTRGEVMGIDGRVIRVTSIERTVVHGIDLATGKRASADSTARGAERLERHETQVSRVRPSIEVLDPDTYQSVQVENQQKAKGLQAGAKVRVVKSAGRIYIIS